MPNESLSPPYLSRKVWRDICLRDYPEAFIGWDMEVDMAEADMAEKAKNKESEEARVLKAKAGGTAESSAEGKGDDGGGEGGKDNEGGKDDENGKGGCGGDNDNDGDNSGESRPLPRLQKGPPPSYRER